MSRNILKVRVINPRSWYKDMKYHVYDVYPSLSSDGFWQVAAEGRYYKNDFPPEDVRVVIAQNMAIAIRDEAHSRTIQQALINQHYVWASYGSTATSVHNTQGFGFITTDERGCIRMCRHEKDIPRDTPLFEMFEVTAHEFRKAEMIEIDGKSYLKSRVLQALKSLDEEE